MARVHVLLNRKGGVGKSTLAGNLAAVTADVLGRTSWQAPQVAGVSIDPQGSLPWWADQVGVERLPFICIQEHRDLDRLRRLRELPNIRHVFVDTPGWIDLSEGDELNDELDPLGEGPAAEALRAVLDAAHDVLVPMPPEPMAFGPTIDTIERVVAPRGLPFQVVINNWDPRDGTSDLVQIRQGILRRGWPLANTVIRHYKIHTRAAAEGLLVTEYPANRVALQGREDFYRLALEHGLGGAEVKLAHAVRTAGV
jgi:chromosome partitioning protein